MNRASPTSPSTSAAGPGRAAAVDALRGAAMLGIVLVNFPTMNTMAGEETTAYGAMHQPLDQWVGAAGMVLLNGKFYPIFAALFGLGLSLASRAGDPTGGGATRLAARRLLLLLGIGLLHLALVWWGDILVVYALLGLLALPCLGWPPRRLLVAGLDLHLRSAEAAAATYQRGTFPEMLRQRALDYLSDFTPLAGARSRSGSSPATAPTTPSSWACSCWGPGPGRRGSGWPTPPSAASSSTARGSASTGASGRPPCCRSRWPPTP